LAQELLAQTWVQDWDIALAWKDTRKAPMMMCDGMGNASPVADKTPRGGLAETSPEEAVFRWRKSSSRQALLNLGMEGCTEDADDLKVRASPTSRRHSEAICLNTITHVPIDRRPARVLMVSRRHWRKNKWVDIVGEFHLDLVQENGCAPIVIPRTTRTVNHLAEYLPMDGLIIAEGNDLSDSILQKYGCSVPGRLEGEKALKWASDTEFDVSKDELEFALMRFALSCGCPILTLCRGCQMLNAMRGGTLIGDIETEVNGSITHLMPGDSPNYDSLRHPINVVPGTPLAEWYSDSLKDTNELSVNSYHHQGVKELGKGLAEMAHAPDGVLEAFYDSEYNPQAGRFVVGLQYHPERMLDDYPGNREVYRQFGIACSAYKARHDMSG